MVNVKKMKNILKIIIALSFTMVGFGQNNIIPVEQGININDGQQENFYLKDGNNVLNKFVGTWAFDDGTHYFKITFYKRIKKFTGITFEDELVSKFLYIENGVTIYDTYVRNT